MKRFETGPRWLGGAGDHSMPGRDKNDEKSSLWRVQQEGYSTQAFGFYFPSFRSNHRTMEIGTKSEDWELYCMITRLVYNC